MIMGRVVAICISEKRGTQKKNIKEGNFIENFGIENDAHAGNWHRQVSLLSYEKIDEFNKKGANVIDGAFGENLVVEGIEFTKLPIGTILKCNGVVLEITQIGKECHNHCEIYKKMGDCIMPRNGVFAKVTTGGKIKCGDVMEVL
jgi:MOSC domain-containing protein YiiM